MWKWLQGASKTSPKSKFQFPKTKGCCWRSCSSESNLCPAGTPPWSSARRSSPLMNTQTSVIRWRSGATLLTNSIIIQSQSHTGMCRGWWGSSFHSGLCQSPSLGSCGWSLRVCGGQCHPSCHATAGDSQQLLKIDVALKVVEVMIYE